MKIHDLYEAVSDDLLYHAVEINRAAKQLQDDVIKGYSSQRVWPDGQRRKEDQEGYENHWLLKGISTTRDFDFAKGFSAVVYVLDKPTIKQKFKIIPYNWGFHIGGGYVQKDKKREREEFVVFNLLKKSFNQLEKDWEAIYQDGESYDEFVNKFDYMFSAHGEMKPLSRYLRGIFLNREVAEIYGEDDENIQYIMNHPKFRGLYKE